MYSCPHCHKQVKNLNKHIKRMHPDQVSQDKLEPQETKPKGKTLELKTPMVKKEKPETEEPAPETKGYHCIDCGASVSKGQNPCPNCGTHLDWSQL